MVTRPLRMHVRTKILVFFLALATVSLVVTGLVAFSIISDAGSLAAGTSTMLGQQAVTDSSAALIAAAEQHLMRIATDQAAVTDRVFQDTQAEAGILATQAGAFIASPPDRVTAPWYPRDQVAPAPDASPVIFLSGTTVTADSAEFRSLAGMYPLLKAIRDTDPDIESVYIATSSGVMWMYPATGYVPDRYDPRTREWFLRAAGADHAVWSGPYVDAAGRGLIMTCSKAVQNDRYGTWVIGIDITIDSINEKILNLTLNGEGYPVLLDQNGNIISRPGLSANGTLWDQPFVQDNAFSSGNPSLVLVAENMTAQKTGFSRVRFNGTESYVAYAPVPSLNWSFAVSLPADRILAPVRETETRLLNETNRTAARIAAQTDRFLGIYAALFLFLFIIVFVLSWTLARTIARPVDTLKTASIVLGSGDLGYRVDLQTGDEFEDLGRAFNAMAADLKASIEDLKRTTAEKERFVRELEIARDIQNTFLPAAPPAIPGIGIAALTAPAMEIGGDFYDFIPAGAGRWGIAIADVSGKGISAALFMALSRTLLHVSGSISPDAAGAVRTANRWIYEDGRSSMFVTYFYGVLDPEALRFSYVNAGHNPPLLVREGGMQELAGHPGIALGVVPAIAPVASELILRSGDLLVLYTDGVTEAFNEKNEAFGEERLRSVLHRVRMQPALGIRDALVTAIRAFTGTAPQSDDITLVVVKVE